MAKKEQCCRVGNQNCIFSNEYDVSTSPLSHCDREYVAFEELHQKNIIAGSLRSTGNRNNSRSHNLVGYYKMAMSLMKHVLEALRSV
jgi:hypothetical protein